ncbi:DNA primase [Shewanella sp. phage 1/4]|uniref:DNA primase n=1 Tax=Shewanella phage 1/4 TaxID=1458859 RepID=UPI0004F59DF1|nr:DNA primase [Shewanella sp. phage 1/4]AHK11297.1 DNA primase [Shewanella sp. phage 1/4]
MSEEVGMKTYKKGGKNTPASIEVRQGGGYGSNWYEETVEDINKLPITAVPKQSILREDAQYFGIRSRIDPNDSSKLLATYFPYPNQEGDIVGYKKRDWTVAKEHPRHFTTVGSVGVKSMLFGQNKCKQGGKLLVQIEGEGSTVAAYRGMLDSLKGTKWEGKITPNVVGLNCGAGNAQESIAHNEKFIRSFDLYVLGLDSDSATPKETLMGIRKGKEATEDIASFLLSDNLRVVDYGEYLDPREMYDDGKSVELGKLLSFGHEKYSPEKVISGDDSSLDDLLEPLKEGHYLTRYPLLMNKIKGLRVGNELITYAAFSGVGKSTLSREFMWELNKAGYTTGAIFLEEPTKKTQQALLALELGVMLPEFRANPLSVCTREEAQIAKDTVLSNGRTYFLNHFGSLKVDKLMQQIRYLHFICGCQHIFLDHVSMVVAGLESNERKDLDMLYEALAAFVTVNDVTVHAVCHLKRVEDHKQAKASKDDDPQPYWREVRKEMLRGSSGIEQMSSLIIVLENLVMPDGTRGPVRTRVEKNREWSFLGTCDVMNMGNDGRMYVCEEPIIKPKEPKSYQPKKQVDTVLKMDFTPQPKTPVVLPTAIL